MKFKRFNNTYLVRIDKGEEIVSSIKSLCQEENIKFGSVTGLGATDNAVLGLFRTSTKEYLTKEFKRDYEITSLVGNISVMNNEVYLHIHATLSDDTYVAVGGHLTLAVVSGTCELFITAVDGLVDRSFSADVGLNLLAFD